jgi:hypothetical protein
VFLFVQEFCQNKMTTDYQKLTLFEIAAICMIVIGVALISFQIFIAMPEDVQVKLGTSMQILDMGEAASAVIAIQSTVIDFAMSGTGEFYKEFYIASGQVLSPTVEHAASALAQLKQVGNTIAQVADYMAATKYSNQEYSIVQSGVEDTFGGRVMGVYFERLELLDK